MVLLKEAKEVKSTLYEEAIRLAGNVLLTHISLQYFSWLAKVLERSGIRIITMIVILRSSLCWRTKSRN